MAAPRTDPGRPTEEAPAPEAAQAAEGAEAAPQPAPAGAWKAWLPLGMAVLALPALAYAVTSFVLVPRMQKALLSSGAAPAEAPAPKESAGEGGEGAPAGPKPGQKQTVPLNKLLVNVAGTMGSRYLLSSIVLSGTAADLPARVAQNEAQLRDLASGLLCTKTIAELEKPGARNLIRGELLASFNSVLGNAAVQEIYFTEFAIQ